MVVADDAAPAAGLKFDATPSAGWSTRRPFATDAYPFSITARAAPLPVATWGYWRGTNITAQPPPSPLDCAAGSAANCSAEVRLRLVPFGGTNIRIAVFPWSRGVSRRWSRGRRA